MDKKLLLEEAKNKVDLLEYIERVTSTKAKKIGGSYFINPCPICGKKDHFAINRKDNYYKSFSECCRGGSIVDFLVEYEKLSLLEAIDKTIRLAGYRNEKTQHKRNEVITNKVKNTESFNSIIEHAHENVCNTDYFVNRGLTDKTIHKYKLGYREEGLNYAIKNSKCLEEKENNFYKLYKYYLPVLDNEGECDYFITRIDDQDAKKMGYEIKSKTHNLKGYPSKLFNQRYITNEVMDAEYIFIVEGIFDALSLEEFDYKAIALNSCSNVKILLNLVKNNIDSVKNKTMIIIPDNDEAGEEAKNKMESELKQLGIDNLICKLPEEFKDVNEYLKNDKEGLRMHLKSFINDNINCDFNICYLDDFVKKHVEGKVDKPIKTGIDKFDDMLGGGLYPGLYTLGAPSSIGKTSFIHQIAENIAADGQDVIFFALEMSRNDLLRKSITREMYLIDSKECPTAKDIRTGNYNKDIFMKAVNNYKDNVSRNIKIVEGNFKINVLEIKKIIEESIKLRKKKPIVFIDYLQIIQPYKGNMSDKQNIDFNITELKRISRDLDICIIAISSLNRSNYDSVIAFESFKESGSIEYSSDVVIGLQLAAINNIDNKYSESEKRNYINNYKAQNPRELELVVLKQREGVSYAKCNLKYITTCSYFCA